MISNKLIRSRGKCNPKTKAYFPFAFHSRNSKSGKKYFLQMQNMSVIYDTNRLPQIGKENLTGDLKSHS